MSKEKIAELQKALASGQKSFDFGSAIELAAKATVRKTTSVVVGAKQ